MSNGIKRYDRGVNKLIAWMFWSIFKNKETKEALILEYKDEIRFYPINLYYQISWNL